MTKTFTSLLLAAALAFPLLALPTAAVSDTLELPADARIDVEVVDKLTLDPESPRRDDIVLRPIAGDAEYRLPEYCVVIGDARLDGERIRISAKSLTCIETHGEDSEIFSGELSAAAYEADGSYGIAACENSRCELHPARAFQLQLASALSIESLENPSEQINVQRRQADGEGVANPTPGERPDPDQ